MVTKKKSAVTKVAPLNDKIEKDICFTIMPFGGWFDEYYENIYRPAIEDAGLDSRRADDLYRPSTIINDIWTYTQKAKLVLADLSGKNPNVFYELGLAHALAKPAILITESMDDVPFDLRALRVLEYNKNDPKWGEILQEKINKSIKEIIAAPLQSVLPAFLSVNLDSKPKSISENEKNYLELRSEVELLRNEVLRTRQYRSARIENIERHVIPPWEAEDKIIQYLKRGMPKSYILRKLREYGVPENFVINIIDKFRSDSNQLSLNEMLAENIEQ